MKQGLGLGLQSVLSVVVYVVCMPICITVRYYNEVESTKKTLVYSTLQTVTFEFFVSSVSVSSRSVTEE